MQSVLLCTLPLSTTTFGFTLLCLPLFENCPKVISLLDQEFGISLCQMTTFVAL